MKQRKTNQAGRSMLEMLGVLAIVGILSVGSIFGYNKAVRMYKINKLSEEYKFEDIELFDMFPQTYHVESVILLQRKD